MDRSDRLSLWTTFAHIPRANGFTTYSIVEVAVLFFGIFLTMIPALELLRVRGGELALGQGLHLGDDVVGVPHAILVAISVGAVAMGANTYIGNAPNFMVKSIAEEAGVRMPSFLGCMLYSGLVFTPPFVCITVLFFV